MSRAHSKIKEQKAESRIQKKLYGTWKQTPHRFNFREVVKTLFWNPPAGLQFSFKIMGKGKKNRSKSEKTEEVVEERFSAAETRPHFRALKQQNSKVVLDERFSSVLTDPRFQLQEKDKYGRKKKKNQDTKEELSSFYTVEGKEDPEQKKPTLSKNDDDDDDDDETSNSSQDSEDPAENREEDSESEDKEEDPASRIAYLTKFSRGELDVSSSSDEDNSSQSSSEDEDEDGEDPVHGTAGVLDPSTKDKEVEVSFDSSPYLVVTSMDWEHVRAVDLFSILSSFTPPGAVKRVQVFQSDFGIDRMAKDRLHGPSGIWKKSKEQDNVANDENSDRDESSDEDEASEASEELDGSIDEEMELEAENRVVADESDFDPEKLRDYEASKLKYFFAVVEFTSPDHADIAYREVDGLEFEHSSSAVDLRTLPSEEVENVVNDRPMRDEATSVPSNYEPPEFVVSALQQTKVECTWDQGDAERERKLTKYGTGEWQDMTESGDLQAYLASDASSDEDSDDEKANKGSRMRKLLGLDSDGEGESGSDQSDSSSDDEGSEDNEKMSKEIKYIPGKATLEEKIRTKLQSKDDEPEELTPWEKYQEKRKQKRKERRQAARNKRNGIEGADPKDNKLDAEESAESENDDDFFVHDQNSKKEKSKGRTNKNSEKQISKDEKAKNELELLLAGEDDEEQARDFDIRGIERMEKNKGKKLRGSRKRKEEKLAADVAGTDFKVDINDNRFAAVLDGSDDRFGIDKTDSNFKDTTAMREILSEQTKRRKKKRRKTQPDVVAPDVSADSGGKSIGSSALSSLVQRLKSKVSKNSQ